MPVMVNLALFDIFYHIFITANLIWTFVVSTRQSLILYRMVPLIRKHPIFGTLPIRFRTSRNDTIIPL